MYGKNCGIHVVRVWYESHDHTYDPHQIFNIRSYIHVIIGKIPVIVNIIWNGIKILLCFHSFPRNGVPKSYILCHNAPYTKFQHDYVLQIGHIMESLSKLACLINTYLFHGIFQNVHWTPTRRIMEMMTVHRVLQDISQTIKDQNYVRIAAVLTVHALVSEMLAFNIVENIEKERACNIVGNFSAHFFVKTRIMTCSYIYAPMFNIIIKLYISYMRHWFLQWFTTWQWYVHIFYRISDSDWMD